MIAKKDIDLVINIPRDFTNREISNGFKVRRAAIDHNIPLITNARLAAAFIFACDAIEVKDVEIKSWDEYK